MFEEMPVYPQLHDALQSVKEYHCSLNREIESLKTKLDEATKEAAYQCEKARYFEEKALTTRTADLFFLAVAVVYAAITFVAISYL